MGSDSDPLDLLGSLIWRGFKKLESFFRENLIWKFQTGASIIIGIDVFASAGESIHTPHDFWILYTGEVISSGPLL